MLQNQLQHLESNTFKELKAPTKVCWNLTSRCNLQCKFCYGPQNVEQELDTKQTKKVLNKLKKSGVQRIVLSGGEPLLRKDLREIILHAHSLDLGISLATNGLLLKEDFLEQTKGFLSLIEITVDGPDNKTEEAMRGNKEVFSQLTQKLEMIKSKSIPIKINTMVCKKNAHLIEQIGAIVQKFNAGCWKIFQFVPRNRGRLYKEEFEITSKEFKQLEQKISAKFPELNIIWAPKDFFKGSYFNIYPDGNVMIPGIENDNIIGNILTQSVEELWSNTIIDKTKHLQQTNNPHES